MLGRQPSHALAFGISQAVRYLRDHLAQGFNADESGSRVFDGVFTHVAGIGRVFFNTEFGQPGRTRTWHEDHDFPEVMYPFSTGDLLRGDDVKVIETNTSTEYWQKGASLLHTSHGQDRALPQNVRPIACRDATWRQGGHAADAGPCANPRNWHDPMPAIRALLVALDRVGGKRPRAAAFRLPCIADGIAGSAPTRWHGRSLPPWRRRRDANDVAELDDWTDPQTPVSTWHALVPQVDADGNEIAGIRLPDIAVPRGTFTGWNLYRDPLPGRRTCRSRRHLPRVRSNRADREPSGDPRPSLEERYPSIRGVCGAVAGVVESVAARPPAAGGGCRGRIVRRTRSM